MSFALEPTTGKSKTHQSHAQYTDVWLTPPHILKPLGPFDLDPCAPIDRPWDTAARHYTKADNGLLQPWEGRVWLNPPYGAEMYKWVKRLAEHGNGIAFIFARVETVAFFEHVWGAAQAVLFLRGRVRFYHADGRIARCNASAPSVLVAYGANNADVLRTCGIDGRFLDLCRE